MSTEEIKAQLRLAYEAGYSQGYADAGDEDGFPDGVAAGFSAWLPENFGPTTVGTGALAGPSDTTEHTNAVPILQEVESGRPLLL